MNKIIYLLFSLLLSCLLVCSCFFPRQHFMLFVIEGINYSNTDVYYYSPEEFDLYEQDNPGRDKEYYVNLHGPAHAHGGKQMIAGGEIATSLSDVFKHDSINIYVLADTLVNKYGVDYTLNCQLFNAKYTIAVSDINSNYFEILFPPVLEMNSFIHMCPSYEEIIAKYGTSN